MAPAALESDTPEGLSPTMRPTGDIPLAIVGMGCRFPGTATSPEKLWEMLETARNAWTPRPPDGRFDMDKFYHPEVGRMGTLFAKGAHFLKQDIAQFDANFFNITSTEASAMDPQIRLLLEVAFETFENAGQSLDRLAGSQTGVFVGSWGRDYYVNLTRDSGNAPTYSITGTAASIIANRVSHFYDLRGPSFVIDTACSSSLVALHQAVLSIRNGDAKQAFVAGVNMIIDPDAFMALGRMKLLSPDGRCWSFDERANGYGRGEGVGSILIKPLSDAIRDGDPIRAIIRGTAINEDGNTPGITLPSGSAQEAGILQAYDLAGIDLEVDYVECHGTGTAAGDPIETKAIAATLAQNRTKDNPLPVGSIKPNIGHLESAAGIAGVIKAVLMLEKGVIPPNALLEKYNKAIDFEEINLRVPQKLEWAPTLSRISVNSFGFGGANAHAVLEKGRSSYPISHLARSQPCTRDYLFILSGHNEKACRRVAATLLEYATTLYRQGRLDSTLKELEYTLHRRTLLRHRVSLTARDGLELITKLEEAQGKVLDVHKSLKEARLAFVFTGQGAQWHAMARELIQQCASFRRMITKASEIIRGFGCEWDLIEELMKSKEASRVEEVELAAPMSIAIQLCTIDALRELGVRPVATVGHSSGEIAAAYAAEAITFEDALASAYYRGRIIAGLLKNLTVKGGMLAIGIGADAANNYISQVPAEYGRMIVACQNSPSSVTVSGDMRAVEQLHELLDNQGIFNRLLKTGGAAYHSHQLLPVAQEMLDKLAYIKSRRSNPNIRWASSVTGEDRTGQLLYPNYWIENLVSPVLFPQALEKICVDESAPHNPQIDAIVEIGPHSTLSGPIKQILKGIGQGHSISYTNVLTRNSNAVTTFMSMLGALASRGCHIDLSAINSFFAEKTPILLTDLPSYPWDHSTRHWHESRLCQQYHHPQAQRHELLGLPAPNFNPLEPSWRNYVRINEVPWLKGHVIHGQIVWPGAGFIAMALEAERQLALLRDPNGQPTTYMLRDVQFSKALVVDSTSENVEIHFQMRPLARTAKGDSEIWNEFRIFTVNNRKDWTEHCRGLVSASNKTATEVSSCRLNTIISTVESQSTTAIMASDFYHSFKSAGIDWHDAFGNITKIQASQETSHCTLRTFPKGISEPGDFETPYIIHPGVFDALFQTAFAPKLVAGQAKSGVATSIDQCIITLNPDAQAGGEMQVYCRTNGAYHDIVSRPDPSLPFQIMMDRFQATEVAGDTMEQIDSKNSCAQLQWVSLEPMEPVVPTITDGGSLANGHNNGNAYSRPAYIVEIIQDGTNANGHEIINALEKNYVNADVTVKTWETVEFTNNIIIIVSLDETTMLSDLEEKYWDKLKKVILESRGILWITNGGAIEVTNPSAATVCGFARTLRVENPALRFVTLDLDTKDLALDFVHPVIEQILDGPSFNLDIDTENLDFEFAIRGQQLQVSRVIVSEKPSEFLYARQNSAEATNGIFSQPGRQLVLQASTPGLLDSLRWVDCAQNSLVLGPDELCIETRAHGVNFRDLLVAAGQLGNGKDAVMAGECSGIVNAVGAGIQNLFKPGDRVCAFGAQPYPNYAIVPSHRCTKIPDSMSFEVAASIPIVYATVVYALIHLCRLQRGESILIHSAAGGVGQTAVMVAQYLGVEVFATVGTSEKRKLLRDMFNIPDDHIFSSRNTSFRQGIMDLTNDRGVDAVLNSLTGEMFRESCRSLAHFGRFVEIGKRDLLMNARMDMEFFLKNITFSAIDLMLVGQHKPQLCRQLLRESIDLIEQGHVQPLQRTVAPLSDVQSVFRMMQAGKHVGKIVMTCDRQTQVKIMPAPPSAAQFNSDASYLIIGGLGGLGRTLISWMADHGAKSIITMSRTGSDSPRATTMIKEMATRGVKMTVLKCDVADTSSVNLELNHVRSILPPIKGIIQAAMVLEDAIFENMAYSQWQAAVSPKIQGTQNLHNYFLSTEQPLDFFFMLSSIVAIVGNSGQAAYAAANAYLDGLARHRNHHGLPAHSINVGVVSDAGAVAENADLAQSLAARGYSTITVNQLIEMLNYAMANPHAATPAEAQTIMGLGGNASALKDPKFKPWLEVNGTMVAPAVKDPSDHISLLRNAVSVEEAKVYTCTALLQQLSKLLTVEVDNLDAAQTLNSYGVDSLLSVELRNWIRAELKANVQLLEMNSGSRTIRDLAGLVAERSKWVAGAA